MGQPEHEYADRHAPPEDGHVQGVNFFGQLGDTDWHVQVAPFGMGSEGGETA
jgi:hypothetical protein